MAFTGEVEALRKMIEGIVAGTASEYNKAADQLDVVTQPPWAEDTGGKYGIDEPGFVSAEEERKVREALELDPDDPLPDHYEIDQWGNVWDLTIQDELERRALAEEKVAGMESENRGRSPAIDAFLDALSNVPADEARRREEEALDRDLAPFKRLYQQGKREAGRKVRGEGDKLKLDWVNEILQELPEDKTPEVIRLPQWTTPLPDHLKDEEERPDLTPFASYLRFLPPPVAAGLLGIGSMLYSKPAY